MTYYCKSFDETINLKIKHKHLQSKKHIYLEEFIIMRYIVENPELTNSFQRFTIYPFLQEYAFVLAPENLFPQLQLFGHE